jgi:ADP-heptose:LPS heptosyltransferase
VSVAPRFLFVPVSGPSGMGEYARCLTLADAARARWPDAQIHFLLSEQAPYARSTPYGYTLFPRSVTLHDAEGREAIRAFRPDVAVFDNAGRKGQFATAQAVGAAVVFVSSRFGPRTKAFRFRWMKHLDEHWIPYPEPVGGALSAFERLKLRLAGRPRIRFLDVMLAPVAPAVAAAALHRLGLAAGEYVLVVPGGGTSHPNARHALAAYESAAARLAAAGIPVVLVGRDAPGEVAEAGLERVRFAGRVPPAELSALLASARLVVTNGGDTLLQSLAFGRPTVAAPIASDQPTRLARCAALGGVVAAALDGASLQGAARELLDSPPRLAALAAAARALGLTNGVDAAMDALALLVGEARARREAVPAR